LAKQESSGGGGGGGGGKKNEKADGLGCLKDKMKERVGGGGGDWEKKGPMGRMTIGHCERCGCNAKIKCEGLRKGGKKKKDRKGKKKNTMRSANKKVVHDEGVGGVGSPKGRVSSMFFLVKNLGIVGWG